MNTASPPTEAVAQAIARLQSLQTMFGCIPGIGAQLSGDVCMALAEIERLRQPAEPDGDATPFLDALDGYIDYGYAIWRKHGMPANTAADLAKHMASAVIGIRRRLDLPVIDPKKYLPGFRDWAKQPETKAGGTSG